MKALKIVIGVIVVLVIAFVVFLMTFDIGKYKGLILEQAKAATGREFTIGEIRMGMSLTPTIVLTDVTFANAAWGSRPQMATVKKVEATAEVLPLLHGQVNISKITVDGADVLLETNKQGKANWEFDTASKDSASSGSSAPPLSVGSINGSNLKVALKDGKTGAAMDGEVKSISAKLVGPVMDMNVANLTINDVTLNQKQGADETHVHLAKAVIEAGGPLKDYEFKKVDVASVTVTGKSGGAPINAELTKLTLDGSGAVEAEGKYDGGTISAKGTLAAAKALKGGGKDVPMKLSLEGMGLKGDVDLTVDGTRTPPYVKGTITVPELDTTKFGGGAAAQPTKAEPAKGAPAGAKTLFPNDPLPWDSLKSVDADVKITVATMKLAGGQEVTNVVLPIKLNNGVLAMNGASLNIAGGQIEASVDANAGSKAVAIKTTAKGLTAESLAKAYKKDIVTGGPLDLNVDVRGSGASAQAIAASLGGSAIIGMGESKISNSAMGGGGLQALLSLVTASNPLAKSEPYTVAKCVVANFAIAGGVANTTNGIAFITDKVQGTGTGKVDLGHDNVDLIVKPQVNGAIGSQIGQLVSTIKVTGPIEGPNFGVDAASSAKAAIGLAAGIATGGAATGLLGLNASNGGGGSGGLLGGLFGGKQQQQKQGEPAKAAPPADVCAAARAMKHG